MLQEDDGLTFAALEGARYRTAFTLARVGAGLTLDAEVSGDGYPEFNRDRFVLVLHGAAPEEAYLDDAMIIGSGGRFEIPNIGVRFSFSCTVTE
jgi:alpha-glucosidase